MTMESASSPSHSTPPPANVSEIVRGCRVHYEIYPESVVLRDHSLRQVGFRLELYGRVGPGVRPGDDRCREVCRGLRRLSSLVVSGTDGGCLCEVAVFPALLTWCGGQEGADACVRLDIRILHGDGCERPIDPAQGLALREMESRLGEFGVSRGRNA
jgi:hypothetical protein